MAGVAAVMTAAFECDRVPVVHLDGQSYRLCADQAAAEPSALALPGNVPVMTSDATGNAARQARYRNARRDPDGPREERLDLHISLTARMALRRLAKHHGQSQKTTLEQILLAAEQAAVDATDDNGATYYTLLDPPPGVTR